MKNKKKVVMASLLAAGVVISGGLVFAGCRNDDVTIDFRIYNKQVQWTDDGLYWHNLISINDLKGSDGTNWTIGKDGFWYKDGQKTDKQAIGTKGNGIKTVYIDINKTTTEKTVYVIEFDDGTKFSLEVKNGLNGTDGKEYTIGDDGYWYADGNKTDYLAIGQKGEDGEDGQDGKGITSITLDTEASTETEKVYVVSYGDGQTFSFTVQNGVNGEDGKDAVDPVIEIRADGYWYINGTNTNVLAQGPAGQDGKQYTIGGDGYWYVDGQKTDYVAVGKDGTGIVSIKKDEDASTEAENVYVITYGDGYTFTFSISNGVDGTNGDTVTIGDDGYWYINGQKTDVIARGENGKKYTIGDDGYWYEDGVKTDYKAIGADGTDGRGIKSIEKDNTNSTPTESVYIITYTDGQTFTFTVTNGEDGTDATTPTIEIGADGFWYINGTSTGVVAKGQDGKQYTIGDDGYWYEDGVKTDYKAVGTDGEDGKGISSIEKDTAASTEDVSVYVITYGDGQTFTFTVTNGEDGTDATTPTIEIGADGCWYINGTSTGVVAKGQDGKQYTIGDDGYWYEDGVKTDYKAIGTDGEDGKGISSIEKDTAASTEDVSVYVITYGDGKTFTFTVINGEDGTDATTPTIEIGADGFWYINGTSTGVVAKGQDGQDGRGIVSIVKDDAASTAAETVYTVTYTDGTTSQLTVKNGTNGTNGSEITIDADGYLCIDGVRTAINQKDEVGSVVTVQDGYWYINGTNTGVPAIVGYEVYYDYQGFETLFDYTPESQIVETSEWIVGMPGLKDTGDAFMGWYIQGTNKKIENYDYIGGDVVLEPRFASLPGGIYENGVLTTTWAQIKAEYPNAFEREGEIKGKNYTESYLSQLTGDLVIQPSITKIGNYAFLGCTGLTSITIPDSVTTIAEYAFAGCTGLQEVVVPSGVTTIGYRAFDGCENLSKVVLPNGLTTIGSASFANCTSLQSIEIPSTVSIIESAAFNNCTSIESFTIPRGISNIAANTFLMCTSLKGISIPSSITSIGVDAFRGCKQLKTVLFNEGLKTIGSGAFANSGITSATIPTTVTKISSQAFDSCVYLSSLTMQEGLTTIEDFAFANCISLLSVEIPSTVTKIGDRAFWISYALKSVTLRNTVEDMGDGVFLAAKVKTIISDVAEIPEELQLMADTIHLKNGVSDSSLTYVLNNFSKQKNTMMTGYTTYMRGAGLYKDGNLVKSWEQISTEYSAAFLTSSTILGNGTTSYFTALEGDLVIPAGITKIGNYAFAGCTGLTSVKLAKDTTTIGNYAFKNCTNLQSVSIPSGVSEISNQAFYGCQSLTEVTLPSNLQTIANNTFQGCSNLTRVIMPENLISIGQAAFHSCKKLVNVNLPETLTSIGSNAFYGCVALTEIRIPSKVTTIATSIFVNCSDLTTVVIDSQTIVDAIIDSNTCCGGLLTYAKTVYINSGIKVPSSAIYLLENFGKKATSSISGYDEYYYGAYGCFSNGKLSMSWYKLKSQYPEAFTTQGEIIGNPSYGYQTSYISYAFSQDHQLIIPPTITKIGDYAFAKTGFTKVVMPDTVTSIGTYAFYCCDRLQRVELSESIKEIPDDCFNSCSALWDVSIPSQVTRIGHAAFCLCESISSLNIPNGVTTIGMSAFYGCVNWKDRLIPASVTTIDASAFQTEWDGIEGHLIIRIDSAVVANSLRSHLDAGGLICRDMSTRRTKVYIKCGLDVSASTYLNEYFRKKKNSDVSGYDYYIDRPLKS